MLGELKIIRMCFGEIVKKERLERATFEILGKSELGEGYLSNIVFIKISTTHPTTKEINVVIKYSNENERFREKIPQISLVFKKEIFIYTRVLEEFKKIGKDIAKEISPNCYGTLIGENTEVLILENLKAKNYKLWNRKIPMDLAHAKKVLELYAKFHSLSFALKTLKPEIFEQLRKENSSNMFTDWMLKNNMGKYVYDMLVLAKNHFKQSELLMYFNYTESEVKYIISGMFFEEPDYHVVLHGDCWTNNYLFKYNKENNVEDVKILDWQCSGYASPIFDLSYFLYACCNSQTYNSGKNLKDLLKIYYEFLENYLREMNVNCKKVFPFSKLLEHWRRFSIYGIIISNFLLRLSLSETEEVPNLEIAIQHNESFVKSLYYEMKYENIYADRIHDNYQNYVKNLNLVE